MARSPSTTAILPLYFPTEKDRRSVQSPIVATGVKTYNVAVRVNGGGISGQADAIKLGIARALLRSTRPTRRFWAEGKFLTREPAHEGTQEVRSEGRTQALPVLEALSRLPAGRNSCERPSMGRSPFFTPFEPDATDAVRARRGSVGRYPKLACLSLHNKE